MTTPTAVQTANSVLTDGTGVSRFTVPKILKDFIVDTVKTAAAVYTAMGITGVQGALDDPHKVWVGMVGAAISAGYRVILSWGN